MEQFSERDKYASSSCGIYLSSYDIFCIDKAEILPFFWLNVSVVSIAFSNPGGCHVMIPIFRFSL